MSGVTSFSAHGGAALLWAAPFIGLILSLAAIPLAAPAHWHRHYPKWAALWVLAFVVPAAVVRGAAPVFILIDHVALEEYLPFVLLLGALYVATGGIHVAGAPPGRPAINTALIAFGTVLASAIGTMGAALLLVRPLLRMNRHRARRGHLALFFILLVANIGGALSPLGDPPLLLGYLMGVPFFWPLRQLLVPTAILAAGLLATFYLVDRYAHRRDRNPRETGLAEIGAFGVQGLVNVPILAGVVATLFVSGVWRGGLVPDALYLVLAALSLAMTPRAARRANDFTWEPMREVAILFAAIFVTLIPVAGLIASGEAGPLAGLFAGLAPGGAPDNLRYFAATGILSAFLDNAPTYLVFFDLAGGDAARFTGALAPTLAAISAGAVYFGALSYIGNAPNLMVKALAEAEGVAMPSFFAYTGLAGLIALPWFALVAVLFFR
jgi:Na+/H+ antiporter NhaD/arsenite permease-like protein